MPPPIRSLLQSPLMRRASPAGDGGGGSEVGVRPSSFPASKEAETATGSASGVSERRCLFERRELEDARLAAEEPSRLPLSPSQESSLETAQAQLQCLWIEGKLSPRAPRDRSLGYCRSPSRGSAISRVEHSPLRSGAREAEVYIHDVRALQLMAPFTAAESQVLTRAQRRRSSVHLLQELSGEAASLESAAEYAGEERVRTRRQTRLNRASNAAAREEVGPSSSSSSVSAMSVDGAGSSAAIPPSRKAKPPPDDAVADCEKEDRDAGREERGPTRSSRKRRASAAAENTTAPSPPSLSADEFSASPKIPRSAGRERKAVAVGDGKEEPPLQPHLQQQQQQQPHLQSRERPEQRSESRQVASSLVASTCTGTLHRLSVEGSKKTGGEEAPAKLVSPFQKLPPSSLAELPVASPCASPPSPCARRLTRSTASLASVAVEEGKHSVLCEEAFSACTEERFTQVPPSCGSKSLFQGPSTRRSTFPAGSRSLSSRLRDTGGAENAETPPKRQTTPKRSRADPPEEKSPSRVFCSPRLSSAEESPPPRCWSQKRLQEEALTAATPEGAAPFASQQQRSRPPAQSLAFSAESSQKKKAPLLSTGEAKQVSGVHTAEGVPVAAAGGRRRRGVCGGRNALLPLPRSLASLSSSAPRLPLTIAAKKRSAGKALPSAPLQTTPTRHCRPTRPSVSADPARLLKPGSSSPSRRPSLPSKIPAAPSGGLKALPQREKRGGALAEKETSLPRARLLTRLSKLPLSKGAAPDPSQTSSVSLASVEGAAFSSSGGDGPAAPVPSEKRSKNAPLKGLPEKHSAVCLVRQSDFVSGGSKKSPRFEARPTAAPSKTPVVRRPLYSRQPKRYSVLSSARDASASTPAISATRLRRPSVVKKAIEKRAPPAPFRNTRVASSLRASAALKTDPPSAVQGASSSSQKASPSEPCGVSSFPRRRMHSSAADEGGARLRSVFELEAKTVLCVSPRKSSPSPPPVSAGSCCVSSSSSNRRPPARSLATAVADSDSVERKGLGDPSSGQLPQSPPPTTTTTPPPTTTTTTPPPTSPPAQAGEAAETQQVSSLVSSRKPPLTKSSPLNRRRTSSSLHTSSCSAATTTPPSSSGGVVGRFVPSPVLASASQETLPSSSAASLTPAARRRASSCEGASPAAEERHSRLSAEQRRQCEEWTRRGEDFQRRREEVVNRARLEEAVRACEEREAEMLRNRAVLSKEEPFFWGFDPCEKSQRRLSDAPQQKRLPNSTRVVAFCAGVSAVMVDEEDEAILSTEQLRTEVSRFLKGDLRFHSRSDLLRVAQKFSEQTHTTTTTTSSRLNFAKVEQREVPFVARQVHDVVPKERRRKSILRSQKTQCRDGGRRSKGISFSPFNKVQLYALDEEERAGKAAAADLSHQAEKKQQLRCLLTARYQTLLLQADKYATELEALRQELSGMSDGEEEDSNAFSSPTLDQNRTAEMTSAAQDAPSSFKQNSSPLDASCPLSRAEARTTPCSNAREAGGLAFTISPSWKHRAVGAAAAENCCGEGEAWLWSEVRNSSATGSPLKENCNKAERDSPSPWREAAELLGEDLGAGEEDFGDENEVGSVNKALVVSCSAGGAVAVSEMRRRASDSLSLQNEAWEQTSNKPSQGLFSLQHQGPQGARRASVLSRRLSLIPNVE